MAAVLLNAQHHGYLLNQPDGPGGQPAAGPRVPFRLWLSSGLQIHRHGRESR